LFTAKTQQLAVDEGGTRSVHPDVKDPPGRTPIAQIKALSDDPVTMLPLIADIKKRYTTLFGN
jgi:iron(III) transport system substrate-binding protein